MLHPRDHKLIRYADGDVPERVRGSIARHLLRCTRCRGVVEALGAVHGSMTESPEPPDDLLTRVLARRQAGERVVLPLSDLYPARAFRRITGYVVAGAAAIVAVSLLPVGTANHSPTEEECVSGLRSLFPVAVLGTSVACADAPTVFELPDSAYKPVTEVNAERVMAGLYVYETSMWTDNIVESPQRRSEITMLPTESADGPVWDARTNITRRVGRSSRQEATFRRATLASVRNVIRDKDGAVWFDVQLTGDSMIGRWDADMRTRPAIVRAGFQLLPLSYAHQIAVLAALPLAEGWAGYLGNRRLAVVAQEEVTVPAGSFITWRIESVEQGRNAFRAWVAVGRPLVVRTETGPVPDRWETRLVSFEPSGR